MLQSLDIIELYCKRLVEHATQLDKPQVCSEEIREAAAGIMFAARWCGDLPELQFARTILEDKFGSDLAAIAKDGTGIVDPMLVWKLSGDRTNMELKKKVVKEIASETISWWSSPSSRKQSSTATLAEVHARSSTMKQRLKKQMDESLESEYGLPSPTKEECLSLGASQLGSREQQGEMENAFENSNSYDQAIGS